MIRRLRSGQRRVFTLFLATALAVTGAFATAGGVAAASPTTKVVVPVASPSVTANGPQLTGAQLAQEQQLATWLGSIQNGQTASMALPSGYTLTASRVGGQQVIKVTSLQPPDAKLVVTPDSNPICMFFVTSAIYGMGAGIFLAAAYFGWWLELPFGIVISPWLAGAIGTLLAAGASIDALVGAFLC
jgi:hypothetical protein